MNNERFPKKQEAINRINNAKTIRNMEINMTFDPEIVPDIGICRDKNVVKWRKEHIKQK